MFRTESECVGPCPQGCMGSACRYNSVTRCYCDVCGEEIDWDSPRWDESTNYHVCEDCEPDEEENEDE